MAKFDHGIVRGSHCEGSELKQGYELSKKG